MLNKKAIIKSTMKNFIENKYFIYLRRSQDAEDRQVASLEDQAIEVKAIAKRLGLNIIDVISESQSAKKPGRPKFGEMIARIHNGEANGILCWKLNRLSRNPIDGGQISWLLQTGVIQNIRTYERDYFPTDNVIIMAVELGMANQFSNDLSVDVKRGMRQKAERGWNPQRSLPVGYSHNKGYNTPEKAGEPEIISTPDLQIVKKLFSVFLEGSHSVPDLQRFSATLGLQNKKGKAYTYNTVLNMLRCHMYYGQFQWYDKDGMHKWHQGKHEPILTEDQFNQVQLLLGKRGRPTRINKYDFAFRGPLTCGECGCAVTAEHKLQCVCAGCKNKFSCKTATTCTKCGLAIEKMKKPKIFDLTYYRCTKRKRGYKCSQGCVEEKQLHNDIEEILRDIEIDKDFYQWAKMALREVHIDEVDEQREIVKRTAKRRDELLHRLNNLVLMRADGEISSDQLKEMKATAEKELAEVEKEHRALDQRALHWVEIADGYLSFNETAFDVFNDEETDLQTKREILQTLGSNLEIVDRKPRFTMAKPLIALKNVHVRTYQELGTFEQEKTLDKQGLLPKKAAAFSTLCAGLDSNQRRHKSTDLQSVAIDRSATDAII